MKLAKLAKHQPQNIFFQINNRNLEFVVQLPGCLFIYNPQTAWGICLATC